MAKMLHREDNLLKWVGVRPAHNGEQVIENLKIVTGGWLSVYTVPTGKTFFLTYLNISQGADATLQVIVGIYNDVPVIYRHIGAGYGIVGNTLINYISNFNPPIEIPGDYSIWRWNSVASISSVIIHGWVE